MDLEAKRPVTDQCKPIAGLPSLRARSPLSQGGNTRASGEEQRDPAGRNRVKRS